MWKECYNNSHIQEGNTNILILQEENIKSLIVKKKKKKQQHRMEINLWFWFDVDPYVWWQFKTVMKLHNQNKKWSFQWKFFIKKMKDLMKKIISIEAPNSDEYVSFW